MSPVGHVVSVVALWTMMLFGLRFAVSAVEWLLPAVCAFWRLTWCRDRSLRQRWRAFRRTIDKLHEDLQAAITTPWSGTLLFLGSILIGAAFFWGSIGDAVKLLSTRPDEWATFDIVTDCIAALCAVTGVAFIQAATAARRTASFMVAGALIATGLGVGLVTL